MAETSLSRPCFAREWWKSLSSSMVLQFFDEMIGDERLFVVGLLRWVWFGRNGLEVEVAKTIGEKWRTVPSIAIVGSSRFSVGQNSKFYPLL